MKSFPDKPRIYLAGAMEKAPGTYGEEWRVEIQKFAEEIGYTVWNPYQQESLALTRFGYSHPKEWIGLRHGSPKDKKRHEKIISTIIKYDLLKIRHETELIACRWDEYAHAGGGTNAELSEGFMRGVKAVTWISCPIEDVPAWLLPCMGTKVFNIEDFKSAISDEFIGLDDYMQ